jgi:hypothetical protein
MIHHLKISCGCVRGSSAGKRGFVSQNTVQRMGASVGYRGSRRSDHRSPGAVALLQRVGESRNLRAMKNPNQTMELSNARWATNLSI